MGFKDIKVGQVCTFPQGLDLRDFGPPCPRHGPGRRGCTFEKIRDGMPPRSYFGSDFRNAKRCCDGATYDFTSVYDDVLVEQEES